MLESIFAYFNQKEVIDFVVMTGSLGVFFVGLFGLLSQQHIIKIFISVAIMETGLFLFFIGSLFVKGYTAPILGDGYVKFVSMNDPIPHAIILTAIVIGMAVFALGMSFVIEYYKLTKITNIHNMRELNR